MTSSWIIFTTTSRLLKTWRRNNFLPLYATVFLTYQLKSRAIQKRTTSAVLSTCIILTKCNCYSTICHWSHLDRATTLSPNSFWPAQLSFSHLIFPINNSLSRFFLQISHENHKDPRFTVSLLFSKSCELWMIKKAKKLGKNTFFSKPKGFEKFRKKHKNIKPIN